MSERLTRVKVVAHAATLADQIGYNDLTITRLGGSLGITPPGVYRHVADLADLQREISRLASQEAAVVISAACAGLSGKAALRALATTLWKWATDHPGRYAALQVAAGHDETDSQTPTEPALDTIGSVLRAYRLEGDDLIDAIRLVRSLLHGFISLEQSGGFKQPRSLEATFSRLVLSLDTALSHWSVESNANRELSSTSSSRQ